MLSKKKTPEIWCPCNPHVSGAWSHDHEIEVDSVGHHGWPYCIAAVMGNRAVKKKKELTAWCDCHQLPLYCSGWDPERFCEDQVERVFSCPIRGFVLDWHHMEFAVHMPYHVSNLHKPDLNELSVTCVNAKASGLPVAIVHFPLSCYYTLDSKVLDIRHHIAPGLVSRVSVMYCTCTCAIWTSLSVPARFAWTDILTTPDLLSSHASWKSRRWGWGGNPFLKCQKFVEIEGRKWKSQRPVQLTA